MRRPKPLAYFVDAPAATPPELVESIWTDDTGSWRFAPAADGVRAALLDQYKLYVEMADRVSARRALANSFFLTLNTALLTAIGFFLKDPPKLSRWDLAIPLVALVGQCLAWLWTVRSYRQLSHAKWAVVGAFETRLPASPWARAEWEALGRGSDPARYWPLTRVEQLVPLLFGLAYVGGFLAVIVR